MTAHRQEETPETPVRPEAERLAAAPAAPGDATGSPPAREAYDAACAERDEYRDLLLRKAAEFDNYRKRVERERREAASAGIAELVEALLPIVDDFERALAADPAAGVEAYRAGVELIHRQLMDLLARFGVTPIQAVGTDFDPRLHEAVLTEANPGSRDGEVIEQFRRGYLLADRLLRPAMVKVAKA